MVDIIDDRVVSPILLLLVKLGVFKMEFPVVVVFGLIVDVDNKDDDDDNCDNLVDGAVVSGVVVVMVVVVVAEAVEVAVLVDVLLANDVTLSHGASSQLQGVSHCVKQFCSLLPTSYSSHFSTLPGNGSSAPVNALPLKSKSVNDVVGNFEMVPSSLLPNKTNVSSLVSDDKSGRSPLI